MIAREIQKEFEQSRREYPIVCVTGPRQSGKTTLARMIASDLPYVNFEDPLARDFFNEDPKGFLQGHASGAIFDEVQHVPLLFSFLQVKVDENPEPGRFILTGSQHFGLSERISQSLAGRAAILELLPFSRHELETGGMLPDDLNHAMWMGAYPPVHDRRLRPDRWYSNYLATYIQRDVRQISQVHNLETFTRFLRLCAGSVGQLLNANRIGTECGADHKTIRNWLTILQTSYVIALLPPFHRSFRKRVIKSPKLYFFDTGLVCHLLNIHEPQQLSSHPFRGAIFENWVFSELAKAQLNRGKAMALSFWRTHGGQEVDFVLEQGGTTDGIEVKSGMTVMPAMLRSLENTLKLWSEETARGWVVYGGNDIERIRNITAIPWRLFTYPLMPFPR
jgi:uncharacterized protein